MKKTVLIALLITTKAFAQISVDSAINYINSNIVTNGTKSITGAKMNTALNNIISALSPSYVVTDSATVVNYEVLNSQNTPPVSPTSGDVYLVGTSPTGAWVGHSNDIATWSGSAWTFVDASQGQFLYNTTNALTYIFRNGGWIQTAGIPALHNGNTIGSGLKIGTNNNRSLTFETNNVNRGRIDSIGRLHIYNLPTSTDTFVAVSNSLGQLGKIGRTSLFAYDSVYFFRTIAQLRTAMTAKTLKKGSKYQATDFQTIYDQPDFHANGTPKDTVVTKTASIEHLVFTATSDSTFAEAVFSVEYPNDKIKFDWTYTQTEIMNAPAKGRISERIDDHFNKTYFDSRSVFFKRYESSTGSGIYSSWKDNGEASQEFKVFEYASTTAVEIGDNAVAASLLGGFYLPNIVLQSGDWFCSQSKIGGSCKNMTFLNGIDGSTIDGSCSDFTILGHCIFNYFGGGSNGILSYGDLTENYFGEGFQDIIFLGKASGNSIWDIVQRCTFGDEFDDNIQYGRLRDCTFGDSCKQGVYYGDIYGSIIGANNFKIRIWGGHDLNIGRDNNNVDLAGAHDIGVLNNFNGVKNVVFSGAINGTGWSTGITPVAHPQMYQNTSKTVFLGSNGSVYVRYFDGTNDVNTIIN